MTTNLPEAQSPKTSQPNLAKLSEDVDDAIRHQHPEWVEADGTCPQCASYVHELAEEMEGRTLHPRPLDQIPTKQNQV